MSSSEQKGNLYDIAVIGYAGRFPGAKDAAAYWRNLRDGVESISFFTEEDILAAGVDPGLIKLPTYVKAGAILEDIELFDAAFFGFNPREAELMDPQHRLFLECASEALEHAGYDAERYDGAIGVYAGANLSTYLLFHLYAQPGLLASVGGFPLRLANDKDFLATRTSYKLHLRGPSVTVQTACSTSLVAAHLACQGLLSRECDIALAGGVSVLLPQRAGYLHQEGMIFSPDGHCRAFDARAQGTLAGNGAGIVVLRRLDDALADGDTIHAVIKGSAINNDGGLKAGYSAPSVSGQAAVISEALAVAGVDPATISYVEAHGSGTPLGDPIEVAALTQAFREATDDVRFCAIGSVKTNIGHLDAAAGAAGLIKTIMALEHRELPPSLHFEQPNPQIDFEHSPFFVNARLSEWKAGPAPRRAGVSSFGMGGTNAHVVVEEAPPCDPSDPSRPWQIVPLSARTATALEAVTDRLVDCLESQAHLPLADVAYTCQIGRRELEHRRVVICREREDAIEALRTRDPRMVMTAAREEGKRRVAFVFPGLGDHYPGMARDLYKDEAVFREHVDRCCELLMPHLDLDLRDVLYPAQNPAERPSPAARGIDFRALVRGGAGPADAAAQKLNQTALAHPALFVVEYALAQLWMSWGIRPEAMLGYSLGEYVSACVAGVFSLQDALRLVARRAQLIQQLPPGAMLAVPLPAEELTSMLGSELSLAAVNGPALSVMAGPPEAIADLERQLTGRNLTCRRLQTTHAFHSAMMKPVGAALTRLVESVSLRPPEIPYLSNVTGTWITAREATDPAYWARHLCMPVRFGDGLRELFQTPSSILIEVGPGQSLSALAIQQDPAESERRALALPSLRHAYDRQPDLAFLLKTLGQLWLAGVVIDWPGFHAHEHRRRVPLPTYPFERQRYWIDLPGKESSDPRARATGKSRLDEWFYVPSWRHAAHPQPFDAQHLDDGGGCWLIFTDESGLGEALADRLRGAGKQVVTVGAGPELSNPEEHRYRIRPASRRDHDALVESLCAAGRRPLRILHLWNVDDSPVVQPEEPSFESAQARGFHSLLFLTQALRKHEIDEPIRIWFVGSGLHRIEDADLPRPEKVTALGALRVIPQEYPHVTCRSIEVTPPTMGRRGARLVDRLLAELTATPPDVEVAYRGDRRWVLGFEPVQLARPLEACPPRLREGGVYLITGGLTGIGAAIATYLARTARAQLALIDSISVPPRSAWGGWLEGAAQQGPVGEAIRTLQMIERLGVEPLVVRADVADEDALRAAVADVERRFGALHGVIHAAGTSGRESFRALSELDVEEYDRQLRPRVHGLFALEKVLRGKPLDLVLVQSSLSSVLGGLGLAAHTAASRCMDAFTARRAAVQEGIWCAINWDAWQPGTTQQVDVASSASLAAISATEGEQALHRILWACAGSQLVVSASHLPTRLAQWVERSGASASGQVGVSSSPHARPRLPTPYVAPSSETEQIVAGVWQELLGLEQVGVHDNFFQLGGHSLLGTQLITRLRQAFHVELSLSAIFEDPTVAGLAVAIEALLIMELEALTDEEAGELVQQSR